MTTTSSSSEIEILRSDFRRGDFRAVLFDFDGTLSLIRRNWPQVMIPMMVDVLAETGTSESRDELNDKVEEFVMRLNGRQTIYQMIQLSDEVKARGGTPRDPLEYKSRYHDLLSAQIHHRVTGLANRTVTAESLTVPGSHQLLERLRSMGLELYLASGTDVKYVREEATALEVAQYFGPHIYGALDDYKNFSKKMIIDQIIHDAGVAGHQLIGFGDGFVEIQEVRQAGGVAIGVASEEERRQGINEWKRNRLIPAGADIIIGDYRCQDELFRVLGLAS
ncbi:MAG: HAD family hydrolase [Pirellulales bacterium]|nr:HAD family hydrolase [Pirellulales bacterium]